MFQRISFLVFGSFLFFALSTAHAQIPEIDIEVPASVVKTVTKVQKSGEEISFQDSIGYDGSNWPEGQIAITIDDGPSVKFTLKVLEILKRYHVHATFFLVGYMAKAHPDLVQEIRRGGHTIGTHSLQHKSLGKSDATETLYHVREGIAQVADGLGETPAPLFRFPYLSSNPQARMAVAREGLAQMNWDRLSLSNSLKPKDGHLKKGILITHDTHNSILMYLPKFLSQMERYGYTSVRLVAPNPL